MGVGHVPQEPVRPEGEGAHLQGRQRGGTATGRDVVGAADTQPDLGRLALGRFGEEQAARWYRQHGYRVLARNWRCSFGEIDLVLGGVGVVVVCEVKTRRSDGFGGPEAAVGVAKQRRLRRLAAAWLAAATADGTLPTGPHEVRFDVVAVVGAKVRVITAAF